VRNLSRARGGGMSGSDGTLGHLPFFEHLAQLDESSPDWRPMSAGLVVLRLFDEWVRSGTPDEWSVRAVRETIGAMPARDAQRQLLVRIVDSIVSAREGDVATIAPRLLAYARALQFDARWELAADVYQTLVSVARPEHDADVLISAYMQLGRCSRVLARWSEAASAYGAASALAEATGDQTTALRSRIGVANLAIDRGNLPEAETILDETIRRAEELQLGEIRAVALQDRAAAAHRRGDFQLAVRLQYAALSAMRDQVARDRVLLDLAGSFFELGAHSAAQDAYLVLAATAQEQYTRWLATINLLEVAARDHRELVFEQYRRELSSAALPPVLAGYAALATGRGYQIFERDTQALAMFERAVDIGSAHRLNQILIEAEQCLEGVRAGRVQEAQPTTELSPDVRAVADALREMRSLAGVAP